MPEDFITFETFSDAEVAANMATVLEQNGIKCLLEKNSKIMEAAYANNALTVDISVKLLPADFLKARSVLEDFYKKNIDDIDADYYLLTFTDEELMEVVTKPDEWGFFDYVLAQKLLKEHGKEIKPELAEFLKKQRFDDLTKPNHVPVYFIYLGYISVILGGIFGLIIGAVITYHKKTLPNGQKIYAYSQKERNNGTRMMLLSLLSIIIWTLIRWYFYRN